MMSFPKWSRTWQTCKVKVKYKGLKFIVQFSILLIISKKFFGAIKSNHLFYYSARDLLLSDLYYSMLQC